MSLTRGWPALAAIAAILACAAPAAGAERVDLRVQNDHERVETTLGGRFSFTTTITNEATTPTEPLVAHLNVVGLDPDVYVDPEDWSPRRTVYLGSLAAGTSRRVTWKMQAVTSGSLASYVAVLPQHRPAAAPVTGPALQLEVAHRTTVAAGGMLPLAIAMPLAIGLLLVVARLRRRHATA